MNCKNCKNWVFGRCTVTNLIVGPDMLCNAWELSQSFEQVKLPYATFDADELQIRINELEIEKDNCLRWVQDLEARLYNFGVLNDEVVDENEKLSTCIADLGLELDVEKRLSNQLYLLLVGDPKYKKLADDLIEAIRGTSKTPEESDE